MRVLVTGGAGYVGSHTVVSLVEAGHEVVVVDNFSNSSPRVMERLHALLGVAVPMEARDIRDTAGLSTLITSHSIDAVIHFAAFKAVGESCERPLDYFENNITGTLSLLRAMTTTGCTRLVFSSSATVYGDPATNPVTEDSPLFTVNPYGRTKLVMEQLIGDLSAADPSFHAAILRYFNPVGAHPGGTIGEDPRGIPNNLMPYICQIAVGRRERLSVFGNDYPTPDGTGVRDYIHVVDLAEAHVAALEYLAREGRGMTANLGTGRGYSVLELIAAFERASGKMIPYEIVARRPGDAAAVWADASRAAELLDWRPRFDLDDMCRDAWRWQSANPNGYAPAGEMLKS